MQKHIRLTKEKFCVFKRLIWRQKWVARVPQLALRSLSPGTKIVVSFTAKYAVPPHMKPIIFELSIRRSQSNFSTVFILCYCEDKDY